MIQNDSSRFTSEFCQYNDSWFVNHFRVNTSVRRLQSSNLMTRPLLSEKEWRGNEERAAGEEDEDR